jgi:hypothetical protein
MIIGMVMLLVVAGVTISMFLNVFQTPNLGESTKEKQEIQTQCQSSCSDWKEASGRNALSAALEYCTTRFTRDVDGDGTVTDIAGSGYNSYCQDGIHCFNVHTCEQGINEVLNAKKCRMLMCEYYTTVGGDNYSRAAEENVHDHIRRIMNPDNPETGVGTCGLPTVTDSAGYKISTWYSPANQNTSFIGGKNDDPTTGLVCPQQYNQTDTGSGGGSNTNRNSNQRFRPFPPNQQGSN